MCVYRLVALCILQLKAEEERHEEEKVEHKKKMKALKEHTQKWESTRDTRVGTWRHFVDKKKANKVCLWPYGHAYTVHVP